MKRVAEHITGNDIPRAGTADHSTGSVNTVRDLIDPVSIQVSDFIDAFDDLSQVELSLWGPALNRIVYPETFAGISPQNVHDYLEDPAAASVLGSAETESIDNWTALSAEDIARIELGQNVFLFEGRSVGTSFLRLRVRYKDKLMGEFNLPIQLSPIETMFRHKNLLAWGGGDPAAGAGDRLEEPSGFPDSEVDEKNFVFLHGYNVNPQQARGWHSALFRRFYWSGLNARFYGITWEGSETQKLEGLTPNYHTNVVNALHTAEGLASFLTTELSGPTVLAAHSLGNMVVSSAIADYPGVNPSHYFLINAAVANEAYDTTAPVVPEMVNSVWSKNGFVERLWASNWYKFFLDTSDLRKTLSWRGRFEDLPNKTTVWNFRSSRDQVFKPHTGSSASTLGRVGEAIWNSLVTFSVDGFAFEAFALQEKFKGRNRFTDQILASTYGGWGLSRDWEIWVENRHRYSSPPVPGEFEAMRFARRFAGWETGNPPLNDDALKTTPFFDRSTVPQLYSSTPGEGSAFLDSIDENDQRWQYRLMAQTIPAVTNGTGRFSVDDWKDLIPPRDYDMHADARTHGPNGLAWADDRDHEDADWLHSDFKNVAYSYTYNMFDQLLDRGEIQK